MKCIHFFLIICITGTLYAHKMDDATQMIMLSDVNSLQQLLSKKSFTLPELVVLDKLNKEIIYKRKTDCSQNHWRPYLNWHKIFLTGSTSSVMSASNLFIIRCLTPSLPTEERNMCACLSLALFGVGAYLGFRLVRSFLAQANELEKTYLKAIQIKCILQTQMLSQKNLNTGQS